MKVFYITGMLDTQIHGVVFRRKMESELIEPIVLDSPGKGRRKKEEKLEDFETTVEDLANELHRFLAPDEPFILLGYSMGAYLSYELYYILLKKYGISPIHIIFMGMEHPDKEIMNMIRTRKKSLTEYTLEKRISESPHHVGTRIHEEMKSILFHDLKIYRNYKYKTKSMKIQCPISVFFGSQEYEYSYEEKVLPIMQRDLFERTMNIVCFEGDHLFGLIKIPEIKMEIEQIIKQITRD